MQLVFKIKSGYTATLRFLMRQEIITNKKTWVEPIKSQTIEKQGIYSCSRGLNIHTVGVASEAVAIIYVVCIY